MLGLGMDFSQGNVTRGAVVLVAAFVANFGVGSALAADDAAEVNASEIVTTVCAACHGEDGNKMMTPETPKIGGQKEDYLAISLHAYKTGTRTHAIMSAVAQGLESDAIDALAEYFAHQESELYTPEMQ